MVAVPLTIIIAIVSGFTFFMEGVEHDALLAVRHSPDILLQQQVGGRTESMYFSRYDDFLQEIDVVKSYFPRSWGYINFPDSKNNGKTKAFVVMGLESDHIKAGRLIDAVIETGRDLIDKDVRKGIIGKAMAKAFKCQEG
jgi:hypothetical protein